MYENWNSDEVGGFIGVSFVRHLFFMVHTAAQTQPSFVWAAWRGVSPYSYRKRYTPGRCSCHPPPAFGLACFWVSSHSPKDGTDRHCRRAWQAEANPSRTAGTSRRTSASLFAEARPPAASSWCVPNTFPPAATDVHILHTGYQKLLIIPIIQSKTLSKVSASIALIIKSFRL